MRYQVIKIRDGNFGVIDTEGDNWLIACRLTENEAYLWAERLRIATEKVGIRK